MIKLTDIVKEIKISRPVSNNLKQLEQIKTQIEQTEDKAILSTLAIKAAELVLPIWENRFPNDDRPRKAITTAKYGNVNDLNNVIIAAFHAAANDNNAYTYAAATASNAAAASIDYGAIKYITAYAIAAVNSAILATKLYFNIDEIKIQHPTRTWDLTKYIPNFDYKDIKIGDKVKIKPIRKIPNINHDERYIQFTVESIERGDDYGYIDPQGHIYWFMFNDKQNSYSGTQLKWFNDQNK